MKLLQRRLLSWYARHRRSLPWRADPTPYKVWISELMLQQTQVRAALPYFHRFVARFPHVQALAAASEQEVLAQWSGLGYYRRAKALHQAARWIVRAQGGRFPTSLEAWLALPGVGRYTAGAILSLAFGQRQPAVDGNVTRVLSRLFLIRGNPRSARVSKALWEKAEEILPNRAAAEFNQALMELGALVCTPKRSDCPRCPVEAECGARRSGLEGVLPELPARAPLTSVRRTAAVIRKGPRVLMYRRRTEELMRDLWELPGGRCRVQETPRAALAREARLRYGLDVSPGKPIAEVRHNIMNRKITLTAYEARLKGRLGGRRKDRRWVEPAELSRLPVSSMTLKVFRALARRALP